MNIIQAITSFFGSYEPLTGTYYLWDEVAQSYVSVTQPIPGIAGVNWSWIAGVAFVLVSLYCLIRLLGVLFKGVLR